MITTITGEYGCWMADGFLLNVKELEIPVLVITRDPTFSDYPGKNDLEEGKQYFATGILDDDKMAIRASEWGPTA